MPPPRSVPASSVRSRAWDAEAAVGRVGRRREGGFDRHRGTRLVGAQGVLDVDDVGGRRDVLEVSQLGDRLDVVEPLGELAAEALDLLGGQLEAGEAGDVEDLVAGEHWSVILGRALRTPPAHARIEPASARYAPQPTPGFGSIMRYTTTPIAGHAYLGRTSASAASATITIVVEVDVPQPTLPSGDVVSVPPAPRVMMNAVWSCQGASSEPSRATTPRRDTHSGLSSAITPAPRSASHGAASRATSLLGAKTIAARTIGAATAPARREPRPP